MILWFRNDLRVLDNPALHYFLSDIQSRTDETLTPLSTAKAIFLFPRKQWQSHHMAEIKVELIERHVELLQAQLNEVGVVLEIEEVDSYQGQVEYIKAHYADEEIVVNQELEINEVNRDRQLIDSGITVTSFESDVVVPKGKLVNQSGEMYKVFTPFRKAWLSYVRQSGIDFIPKPDISVDNNSNTQTGQKKQYVAPNKLSKAWPLSDTILNDVIPNFLSDKVADYQQYRDFPSIKATSGLSAYLAIGAISPRYLVMLLLNRFPDLLSDDSIPAFSWLNELVWREFYRHLLYFQPELAYGRVFQSKYQHLPWPNNMEWFEKWCQGKTGYPLVDAAMRQLNQTGWMHNRLRMVVASFLTKHLLIDWRFGERYFMSKLIDGDFAANNGGWQWAASTGCDAQPYFRIFNPIRQSERFDPDGHFIRKYLPELAELSNKDIHFPHKHIQKHKSAVYWPAIVEHKVARENALAFYKAC